MLQDLRYGIRMLAQKPGFTLAAVITLAAGIGLNTAVFSVINSVLLRPLPYKEPARLVQVWETTRESATGSVSPNNFLDWAKESKSLEAVSAAHLWLYTLTGTAEPTEVAGMKVSTNFFALLGETPQAGRAFLPEEGEADKSRVAVISHQLWQRDFGGADPIGKAIKLDGESYTVVGVLRPEFRQPVAGADYRAEVWTPLVINPAADLRGNHYLRAIARLGAGTTLEEAQAEMNVIARGLEQAYPVTNTDRGVRLVPLHQQMTGNVGWALLLLQCATGFVLLIACINVANLLLARVAAREKEMAIRSALGAGRFRIVRLLLAESFALAGIGAALGLLLAVWGIDALVSLAPQDIPRLNEVGIDGRALGFALALSLLTVFFFGLAPAWQAAKININEALKESSRTASRGQGLRGALVVAEVALTLVLLVGSGLLLRSLNKLQGVDLGFNPDNLLVMRVSLLESKYKERAQVADYYRQALERIGNLPGVRDAAISTSLPMSNVTGGMWISFEIEGQPAEPGREPTARYRLISPTYFRTMGMSLTKGREFSERDSRGAPAVVIVNERFVSRHFAGADPIGKKIIVNTTPREIVGVAADIKHERLDTDEETAMYVPHAQNPRGTLIMVVRTEPPPASLTPAISRIIWDSDPDAAVSNVTTMGGLMSDILSRPRFNTLLLAVFSAVATVLAAVGIYGVLSYTVAQSTREIGIRMALGASSRDVLKLIVGQGLALGAVGVVIGIVGALGLTQFLKSMLFGVAATDPVTFTSIPVLLLAVVTVACYVPARRATRVDPMVALRYE